MSTSKAAKKLLYSKLIPRWPADPLRPHAQFQNVLNTRLERDFGDPLPISTPTTNSETPAIGTGKEKERVVGPKANADTQWIALVGLLDDRYSVKYPITTKLTEPASNPQYYHRLIAEMDEVPKRSWLGNYLNSWRGYIRWE